MIGSSYAQEQQTAYAQDQLLWDVLNHAAKDKQVGKAQTVQTGTMAPASVAVTAETAAADNTVAEQSSSQTAKGFFVRNGQGTDNSLTKDGLWVGGQDDNTGFRVDNDGNVKTDGSIDSNSLKVGDKFSVNKDGEVTASNAKVNTLNSRYNLSVGKSNADGTMPFFVNSNGSFYAAGNKFNVQADGSVKTDGSIDAGRVTSSQGFFVKNTALRDGSLFVGSTDGSNSVLSSNSLKVGDKFSVNKDGEVTASNAKVNTLNSRYNLSVGKSNADGTMPFFVNSNGSFYAAGNKFNVQADGSVKTDGSIDAGRVTSSQGFFVKNTALRDGSLFVGSTDGSNSVLSSNSLKVGDKFSVNKDGEVTASSVNGVTFTKSADKVIGDTTYKTGTTLSNVGDIVMQVPTYKAGEWGWSHNTPIGVESRSFAEAGLRPGVNKENGDDNIALGASVSITSAPGIKGNNNNWVGKVGTSTVIGANSTIAFDNSFINKYTGGEGENASNVVVIGNMNASRNSANAVILGSYTNITDSSWSIGIGSGGSIVNSAQAIAIGHNAGVKNTGAVAIGAGSSADGKGSVALGFKSQATAKNSIAIGANSVATEENTISVGNNSLNQRRIVNVAAGTAANDAVIVSQFNGKGGAGDASFLSAVGKIDWKAVSDNANAINTAVGKLNSATGASLRIARAAAFSLSSDVTSTIATAGEGSNSNRTDNGDNGGTTVTKDGQIVNGKLTVKGDTELQGNLTVTGDTELKGNATVTKDFTVNGQTNLKDTKVDGALIIKDGASTMNVADRINSNTDAIQKNSQNIASISMSVNKLDNRIDRVGAGAAALAALHPLDYDPEAKLDFAAGYGNYRSANAVAVGAYYRPNETTMFSVGGAMGGGENMVNVGASFKIGSGTTGTSRAALAGEVKDLKAANTALTTENKQQKDRLDAQQKQIDDQKARLDSLEAQLQELLKAKK